MDLKSFLDLERERLFAEREQLNVRCDLKWTDKNDSLVPREGHNHGTESEIHKSFNPSNTDEKLKKTNTAKSLKELPGTEPTRYNHVEQEDHCRRYQNNKQDDMEQWISDTFYSHFPGYNNEYQKRQQYLQSRQRENQENLIRHQMQDARRHGKTKLNKYEHEITKPNVNSARSNESSITSVSSTYLHETSKHDIDDKQSTHVVSKDDGFNSFRSGSSRHKLLQDLRHTNLANVLTRSAEDEMEQIKKKAELESARKKKYQQELMQQIEEKRRSIRLIKEKEIQREKVLTRRLQEQLKTMRLEEQLEKERIKAAKIRYDAEQNHFMREHLLAKLANDSKLLQESDRAGSSSDTEINKENVTANNDNKVYKYFSNSEKHEYNYRKKSALPAELIDFPKIEKECFHLSEKICPTCDGPLKEFDDYCLRCQKKTTLPMKVPLSKEGNSNSDKTSDNCNKVVEQIEWNSAGLGRSFLLACVNCELFYTLCPSCLNESDFCKACQNKRNVCMNCRRTLCSFCLEEVACGKDTETSHVNDVTANNDKSNLKKNEDSEIVTVIAENCDAKENESDPSAAKMSLGPHGLSMNNLNINERHPPFSINIERDSIFHPNNVTNSRFAHANEEFIVGYDKELQKDNTIFFEYDEKDMEKLNRETDSMLTRYFKNYGELAYQTRGTQTTPNTSSRRDVVISGEHSLTIPLLREMPKMIRNVSPKSLKRHSNDIENLKRRWDIPAVQKHTVSQTSPKVVTQIGAIRRQLQTENLFSDDGD